MKLISLLLIFLTLATAGDSEKNAIDISGTVRDLDTGLALAGVSVGLGESNAKTVKTDSQGRYQISDVSPGRHRVSIAKKDAPQIVATSRLIVVAREDKITGLDFRARQYATLFGVVLDPNKKPVANVRVEAQTCQQSSWGPQCSATEAAVTDDMGKYKLERLPPNESVLVVAAPSPLSHHFERVRGPVTTTPPPMRPGRAYYPNATSARDAQPLLLRSGEQRAGVDFVLPLTVGFCATFSIPPFGPNVNPTLFVDDVTGWFPFAVATGAVPEPGKTSKLCGLPPGNYRARIALEAPEQVEGYGTADFIVKDRDVKVAIAAAASLRIIGAARWDDERERKLDPPANWRMSLRPIGRPEYKGEHLEVETSIPGDFALHNLLPTDYAIVASGSPYWSYLKELRIGNTIIRDGILHREDLVPSATLHLEIGTDGGALRLKAVDENNKPVSTARFAVISAQARPDLSGMYDWKPIPVDQNGECGVAGFPPGKYFVIPIDDNPLTQSDLSRLYAIRESGTAVEVKAGTPQQTVIKVK